MQNNLGDPFYWEEDKFIEYFDKFINSGNTPFKKPEKAENS